MLTFPLLPWHLLSAHSTITVQLLFPLLRGFGTHVAMQALEAGFLGGRIYANCQALSSKITGNITMYSRFLLHMKCMPDFNPLWIFFILSGFADEQMHRFASTKSWKKIQLYSYRSRGVVTKGCRESKLAMEKYEERIRKKKGMPGRGYNYLKHEGKTNSHLG